MTEHRKQSDEPQTALSENLVPSGEGKWRKAIPAVRQTQPEGEEGGPRGLEPTRYGDWERKGIVSDF